MKVVCDTNVLVSAFLSPYWPPAKVLALFLDRQIAFCYDGRILAEYEEVLLRPKFKIPSIRVLRLLDSVKMDGEIASFQAAPMKLSDPDDVAFLEVALAAKADYLITGNVNDFKMNKTNVRVVTPARFIERYYRNHQ